MRTSREFTIVLSMILLVACNNSGNSENENIPSEPSSNIPIINYSLNSSFPHDTGSFTEGLLIHNGQLYESTGSPEEIPQAKSLFGTVDLKTGRIDKKIELDRQKYFGEGIVFLNDKVYQLTYQTKVGFIYDAKTFNKIGEFTFPSKEGWGMTTDGSHLIMTDGTNIITYLETKNFTTVKTINVTDDNGPVTHLNEPEFIKGYIYANIYTTNYIVKIDPASGKVVGKIDLTSLATEAKIKFPGSLEMNGIAYDSTADKIYVTGKMWPNIYAIEFNY